MEEEKKYTMDDIINIYKEFDVIINDIINIYEEEIRYIYYQNTFKNKIKTKIKQIIDRILQVLRIKK